MNPKQFLLVGGVVLVLVGILGFVGVIGPTPESSLFGSAWWFDNAENWAHLVLGIVALVLAYTTGPAIQRPVVMLLGIVGVLVGLYSLLGYPMLLGANLENPADSLLHLVVGIWALAASWRKQAMGAAMGGM
ncbi:MAG: hypothetical protein HY474_01215 [Candidatus Sungbacteria bacterium]|uniref:DUF4383 domain-containing protein n=1 Tax=Candidatus Sungiibacteriota bacterium TaxID=2750080 RepID=A0A932YYB7_9BACT|nr:hypothetical protein [Candidatus Sungbacteria bacterium]